MDHHKIKAQNKSSIKIIILSLVVLSLLVIILFLNYKEKPQIISANSDQKISIDTLDININIEEQSQFDSLKIIGERKKKLNSVMDKWIQFGLITSYDIEWCNFEVNRFLWFSMDYASQVTVARFTAIYCQEIKPNDSQISLIWDDMTKKPIAEWNGRTGTGYLVY